MDSTGRCLHPTCGLWVSLGLLLTRGKQPDEHHRLQHTAENVQELQLGIHDLTCTPGHQACAQYLMDLTCDDDSVNYRDQEKLYQLTVWQGWTNQLNASKKQKKKKLK